ncbi:DUF4038 domain-containing protein [candidate division KSB1 bacterium]|nr:DUF4038 domain-containing protein [candidate division KSB1 bacterium]
MSPDKRYLQRSDGQPFVWIGDTAWELFHRLDREQATEYLANRAQKGFTLVQAVVLAELDGLRTPNPYGEVPFIDMDPTRPNEAYFEHVDFIVNKAEELGLFMGLLPTWGDKIYSAHPGAGPVVFNSENAKVYGEFLGKRYAQKPVIWILGGDRNIANQDVLDIWDAMAKGLKRGCSGKQLITYHPRGGSMSATFLHNKEWLDFNMYQSGHMGSYHPVYRYAEKLALFEPRKPFVDGEPAYEDIAVKFWEFMDWSKPGMERVPKGVLDSDGLIQKPDYFKKGFIDAHDVRVHAYWDFLAGACGYTYGNNAIWQMCKKGNPPAIPCLTDWREAMDRPGAADMRHVRDLFESRPFDKVQPDQSIIYGPNPDDSTHIQAAGSTDGSFIIVYLSVGQPVNVVMEKLSGPAVAWWFDPRDGLARQIGEFKNQQVQTFTPPSSGYKKDWVLVIDSIKADYSPPGQVSD